MLSSKKSSALLDEKEAGLKLKDHNLAFVDWDKVYFELQKYKNERSWYNLAISKNNLIGIMNNSDWYEISIPESNLEVSSFHRVFMWEEIVISLLKLYTEKFYLSIKNKYLARHIEVSTLEEDHPNFIDEYIIQVEESETDIIRNVIEFKDKVKEDGKLDIDFEMKESIFYRI